MSTEEYQEIYHVFEYANDNKSEHTRSFRFKQNAIDYIHRRHDAKVNTHGWVSLRRDSTYVSLENPTGDGTYQYIIHDEKLYD